jgi:cation diffusion facilitator CzcD-associated flavoprotein CzcO
MTRTASDFPILIVGAGFAGLGMAIQLKKAGVESFTILEKAGEVGGTWRDNSYPGCACDVPSHLYSFSFEPNPGWSRMYSAQPEIWDYLKHCADKYRLRPHIRFNEEMTRAEFDEAAGEWRVHTARGERLTAKALILAAGGLSTPADPQIEGLSSFRGKVFHSQQWDHGFDLRGKRVAVLGTGASAIQIVPQIAPLLARLDLYQRTPPWILPRPDRATSARERSWFARFPVLQRLVRTCQYWVRELRVLPFVIEPRLMKYIQRLAERHLAGQVPVSDLRTKLTPDYTIGCKRILLSDDYYPALLRTNVELITEGIREIRPEGIVARDGTERKVDAIILATGFRATQPVERGVIKGRGGRDIWEAWRDGPEAFLGTAVAGFPNLFFLVGPNTGLGHNSMVFMIESHVRYVIAALHALRRGELKLIEVRPEVQADYNRSLQEKLRKAVWSAGGCKSWYLDANGKNVTLWPGFTWRFRQLTGRFRPEQYVLQAQERSPAPAKAPGREAA